MENLRFHKEGYETLILVFDLLRERFGELEIVGKHSMCGLDRVPTAISRRLKLPLVFL